MKETTSKLFITMSVILLFLLTLIACSPQPLGLISPSPSKITSAIYSPISAQASQPSSATDTSNTQPIPVATETPSPSDPNTWNLDYATIKYDKQGNQLWAARYNGPGNAYDIVSAVAADDQGNTYVAGSSMGSNNGTSYDYATIKYDPDGKQIWVARYHGSGFGNSGVNAMAIDKSGNIYVTGESSENNNVAEFTTLKYDSEGNRLWVAHYSQPGDGNIQHSAMAIDDSGNIYVTGLSIDKNSISQTSTIKYQSNGHQLWAVRQPTSDGAWAIALDKAGNVIITGLGSTIKYDSNGKELWMIPTGSQDFAIDNKNNIYLTATAKFDSNGKQLWTAAFPQENWGNKYESATGIMLDNNADVYVTGWSEGMRANPSGGGVGLFDYTTIKYDTNGKKLWLARYGEPINGHNLGWALALDSSNNTYVTGTSQVVGNGSDFATVKYDNNGHQLWAVRYRGSGNGENTAQALAVDCQGNVYVAGQSAGTGISELTQSPYPNIPVYRDPQTIQIKIGNEMAFGFDTFTPGGLSWTEKHDETSLALIDQEEIALKPSFPSDSTTWFLFKPLKAGQTQIIFIYGAGRVGENEQRILT